MLSPRLLRVMLNHWFIVASNAGFVLCPLDVPRPFESPMYTKKNMFHNFRDLILEWGQRAITKPLNTSPREREVSNRQEHLFLESLHSTLVTNAVNEHHPFPKACLSFVTFLRNLDTPKKIF